MTTFRSDWLPAILLLVASLFCGTWLELQPTSGVAGPVTAVFPPWWTARHVTAAVASTGDVIIRAGGLPNSMILVPRRPGWPERLRAAGAWVVLDPVVPGLCHTAQS